MAGFEFDLARALKESAVEARTADTREAEVAAAREAEVAAAREVEVVAYREWSYREEVDTHLALASRIAGGKADVGPGIEAAARSYNLGFLPLFRERYDLVIPTEKYHGRLLKSLVKIAGSEEFHKIVTEMGGYDTSETGNLTFIH